MEFDNNPNHMDFGLRIAFLASIAVGSVTIALSQTVFKNSFTFLDGTLFQDPIFRYGCGQIAVGIAALGLAEKTAFDRWKKRKKDRRKQ